MNVVAEIFISYRRKELPVHILKHTYFAYPVANNQTILQVATGFSEKIFRGDNSEN